MNLVDFNKRINRIFSKYLSLNFFYTTAELFLFFSIWFILFSVIDNILNFNVFFRWLNLTAFMTLFGKIIFKHYLKIKKINKGAVLVKVEDTYNFKDTIISGYELQNSNEYDEFYISNILKQAFSNLKKIKFSSLINFKKFKTGLISFFSCLLFLTMYSFVLPDNFSISFSRFVNPSYKIKYSHKIVKLEIYPKNIYVLEGKDVNIRLITYGKVKDASLVMKNRNNIIREKFNLTLKSNVSTNKIFIYNYNLISVYDNFVYYGETVQTRDNIKIRTPEYNIKVVKEPSIKELKLVYIYPSYTRLKPEVVNDNGNIEAVEKTVIKISGKANNNLSRADLFYNKKKIRLSISDNYFKGKFMLHSSGKYHIKFIDENRNSNTQPVNYSIIVIKDYPPTVDIVKPGMDINIPESSEVSLSIYAQDDYAVEELKLYYRIKKAFINQKMKWNEIPFEIQNTATVIYKYKWDLNNLRFLPGDIIEYYAQVYDGYKPPGKHTVQSKRYFIKFPTMEEMYRQVNRQQEQHVTTIEKILKNQKKLYKEMEKLIQNMDEKKNMSYIEKKELEKLRENQKRISESAEKLSKQLRDTHEKMRKKDMFTLEIMDKMKAIQELLKEVQTKQMMESIERLNEAIKNIKLSDAKKEILSQKITQEEILKRLEKTLNMLKDMKNKQRLESYRKITEELIEKQKELLNKTMEKVVDKNKHSSKDLKEKQKSIKKSYNEMEQDMNQFEDELKKENSSLKDTMSELNKKAENLNINKDFDESARSIEKNKLSNSAKSQEQILSKMNSMNSKMCKMSAKSQQIDITKILNAIDETIFNLLKTSEKIERYKKKIDYKLNFMKNLYKIEINKDELYKVQENVEIAEDLIFLERSIRWNKKNLEEQTKESIIFNPSFFDKFENLSEAIFSARKSISENRISTVSSFLINGLLFNNIILKDLLESKENFKNQMQRMASQGMGDTLNQMADAQEKLNELTERMMGQVGKNGMTPGQEQYLEELAFQQDMIKQGIESFMKNNQQARKLLGNLGQAAKEMNEIKEKLKSKKIDNNLLKKQKKVLKRLLDSEKSLYVKDKSKKREAETAKEYKAEKPQEIAEEKIEYKSKNYYHRHINRYPLEYKKLIDNYFKVLNSIER